MKISRLWLSDYVDLEGIEDSELMLRLTMGAAEFEEMELVGEHLKKVITAKVMAVEPHPNSDKLHLVDVEFGCGMGARVVCGAPNVRVGMITAFAPVGAKLPGGEVKLASVRGVESRGMLCSEAELGISDDHSGIMDVQGDVTLGMPIVNYAGVADAVFEIDNKSITHRPDLWGHLGMAREVAALYGRKLEFNADETLPARLLDVSRKDNLRIDNRAPDLCPRYCAISVKNLRVAQSPEWMQKRLKAAGHKPRNNIVDVTNYVMLELAQPLHAFDRRQIKGDVIVIRRASEGEKFTTLDGNERELLTSDVMIADAERAVALGGVMGGLNSEIEADTTDIVIESANFEPATIRRTANRLDLRTDAAMRFEKSQDPENCPLALYRALALLKETCPDMCVASDLLDDYPVKLATRVIEITAGYINRQIGMNIPKEKIVSILRSLQFGVEEDGDALRVTVPSFRATKDITNKADIVEEIGRVWGFDNIAQIPPKVVLAPPAEWNAFRAFEWKTRDVFALELGFNEVYNYSFVGEELLAKCRMSADRELRLKNDLSSQYDRLRRNLIPGMLTQIYANCRYFDDFALFELGRAYLKDDRKSPEPAKERTLVAASMVSRKKYGVLDMKEAAARYMERMQLADFAFVPTSDSEFGWVHPGRALAVMADGAQIGHITQLHPAVAKAFDIEKFDVILAELDLTSLFTARKREARYEQWSAHPTSVFEVTAVADERVYMQSMLDILKTACGNKLMAAEIFDVYAGERLEKGKKAVSFRLTFGERDRTLASEEIEALRTTAMSALESKGYPIRK